MNLLWIATKPPQPPIDGGRLATLLTLEALSRAGVETTLVAPRVAGSGTPDGEEALRSICRPRLVHAEPPHPVPSAVRSFLGGPPYTVHRHALKPVRAEVARLLKDERFDCVHCEQMQAFAQAEPACRAGIPVVLRAQNVESDLWRAAAPLRPWLAPWITREARRLARYEGKATRAAAATIALTERDASRLASLGGDSVEVHRVPPPFPSELPSGGVALPGKPPVVLFGSAGWLPNRDANRWFIEEVWPEVLGRVPGALLHLFATAAERSPPVAGVRAHARPRESRDAFPSGAVFVVPLRVASGIRMKILEAWARGVPVIATPEAAAGLDAKDLQDVLIASTGGGFAEAIGRLGQEQELRSRLVAAGRRALAARHDPGTTARALRTIYARASARGSTPIPPPP